MNTKNTDRIYKMDFAAVYPMYVQKAEKKGRTKKEVNEIIFRLTGYDVMVKVRHTRENLIL